MGRRSKSGREKPHEGEYRDGDDPAGGPCLHGPARCRPPPAADDGGDARTDADRLRRRRPRSDDEGLDAVSGLQCRVWGRHLPEIPEILLGQRHPGGGQEDRQVAMTDTIFALASGMGRAGVAVVRLSGPAAGTALLALAGALPPPRTARLARLTHGGAEIDQALLLWFAAPASFTGEDVAEIHLHGGRAVREALFAALA